MLLKRFLVRKRIEEKLAPLFVFLASRRVRDVLSHVISPFLIQLGEPIELFQEEFDRLAKPDEEWRSFMPHNLSYSARSQEDEERRQFFLDSPANRIGRASC